MSRSAFFRQSGWMMMATVAGGAFMWAVHIVLEKSVDGVPLGALADFLKRWVHDPMPAPTYGLFDALLRILTLFSIPVGGIQTVFAQQAALAITDTQQRQLRGTVRAILVATLLIWVASVACVIPFHDRILADLKIADPAALYVTLLTGLAVLWTSVLTGVLQGQQNFFWLGWQSILGGVGRCAAMVILVRVMGGQITAATSSVFASSALVLLICGWQTSGTWRGPRESIQWRAWLSTVIPLTFGLGASTFIMSADGIIVRKIFPQAQTGYYSAAGIIGRALVFFTIPLAAVMFPKIVQSAAKSEKSDVLAHALGATALAGGGAALICTLFPDLPLRIVYNESFLFIKPLVPWFAWCMLPLTLSNVLVNNLLARQQFKVVPWLIVVAALYTATLYAVAKKVVALDTLTAFERVVQTLGVFSLLLLGVAAWFTWRKPAAGGRGA